MDNKQYLKMCFTRHVFTKFTDECGGDPYEFGNALFARFRVNDFAYSDDWMYHGIEKYFTDVVVPHKIAVYKAGIELLNIDAINEFIGNEERSDFKHNLWQHDMSKFSANEAFGYAMHDFKNPKPDSKSAFEAAWHHHKMNNPHHPEYWLNPNRSGILETLPMPKIFILEMIADWIGAGKTYGSTLQQWLPANIEKFKFHSNTRSWLQQFLLCIGINVWQHEGGVLTTNFQAG